MKKIITAIVLLFYINGNAQFKTYEIGVFLGTAYYMGELNQNKVFYQPSAAISLVYKVNFNDRFSLRFNASYAGLKGNDALSDNKYNINRNHKFDIKITEFTSLAEFNFLEYKPLSRFDYYSFYLTMGTGVLILPADENSSLFNMVFPVGIGFKYAFNKRLGFSIEWIYRKTLTDYIDQLPEQTYTEIPGIKNKQLTNNFNKDWYSFAGVTLTYKFALGNSKCAAYD